MTKQEAWKEKFEEVKFNIEWHTQKLERAKLDMQILLDSKKQMELEEVANGNNSSDN